MIIAIEGSEDGVVCGERGNSPSPSSHAARYYIANVPSARCKTTRKRKFSSNQDNELDRHSHGSEDHEDEEEEASHPMTKGGGGGGLEVSHA